MIGPILRRLGLRGLADAHPVYSTNAEIDAAMANPGWCDGCSPDNCAGCTPWWCEQCPAGECRGLDPLCPGSSSTERTWSGVVDVHLRSADFDRIDYG